MNCQEIDSILIELVRGELPASSAVEAHAHAATCARCAALLSSQQNLSAALEAFASHTERMQAPERIEAALKLEFRRQHAATTSPAFQQRTAASLPRSIFRSRRTWAAAASALIVAGVIVMNVKKSAVKPLAAPETKGQSPQLAKGKPDLPVTSTRLGNGAASNSKERPSVRRTSSRWPLRAVAAPHPRLARTSRPITNDETTTSFYPLPYGSGLGLDEGWEMVRVAMPVSALAPLGVPVISEQESAGFVKADVVLGEDGMPRAIRFVK